MIKEVAKLHIMMKLLMVMQITIATNTHFARFCQIQQTFHCTQTNFLSKPKLQKNSWKLNTQTISPFLSKE